MGRWLSLVVLIGFTVISLLPVSQPAAQTVKFGIPNKVNPLYMLPVFAGEEKGVYKQGGINIQTFFFRGGGEQHRAVAAGSVNMGLTSVMSLIQAVSRGLPEIIVADVEAVEDYFIVVPRASPITGPAQLKGAKIGAATLGGAVHAYGRAVAKPLGLEKDMKFVATGGVPTAIAALRAGVIDGIISSFFSLSRLLAEGELRKVVVVADFLPRDWVNITILARRDMLEKEPGAVKKMVKAYLDAGGLVLKEREWALKKIETEFGHSPASAALVFSALRYSQEGKINAKGIENVRNFVLEYGIVSREDAAPLDRLYTRQITG